jgi:hypothetical protein
MPRSRGDARAFLRRGWAWSHKTRGDSGTLSCASEHMARHRSPILVGGVLGASGHVATPESSPGGWRALCHGHVAAPEPSPAGCGVWRRGAGLLSLVHRGTRSVGYQQ